MRGQDRGVKLLPGIEHHEPYEGHGKVNTDKAVRPASGHGTTWRGSKGLRGSMGCALSMSELAYLGETVSTAYDSNGDAITLLQSLSSA